MVAFSHTFFDLAHHTICTYYTMILGLAPYDFLLRGRRKKAHSPALSVGGVGPAKSAIPNAYGAGLLEYFGQIRPKENMTPPSAAVKG